MKASKFFEMSNDELNTQLATLKEELFNLRFKQSTNDLSNPMQLNVCKKDIAKVMTVLRQRELGISKEPVKSAAKKTKKSN